MPKKILTSDLVRELAVELPKAFIGRGVAEITTPILKDYAKELANNDTLKNILEEETAVFFAIVTGAVTGSLVATIVAQILKQILIVDENRKILQGLQSEPFETGLREAWEAFELSPHDEDGRRFRNEKLRYAVEKLSSAWSLFNNSSKKDPAQRLMILLVRGLCELSLPGGAPLGQQRIREVIDILEKERKALVDRIKNLKDEASSARREIAIQDSGRGTPIPPQHAQYIGYTLRVDFNLPLIEREISQLDQQSDNLSLLIYSLKSLAEYRP